LTLEIKSILIIPVKLEELRKSNIFNPKDTLQGKGRYLNEEKSEKIKSLFDEMLKKDI
jgi:hypothetical protein